MFFRSLSITTIFLSVLTIPAITEIELEDCILKIDSKAFNIKGICWNPVIKGFDQREGLAFRTGSPAYDLEFIERDLKLIANAGFNTLRPYSPITDQAVLELIEKYELMVIVPVLNFHEVTDFRIRLLVKRLANHPTTLLWEIGNEWNYNNFYNPKGEFDKSLERIQETISLIRSTENRLPISTNYGELPSKETVEALDVDIWGLNIYRSDNFRDLFKDWKALSGKPIYLGEYGADAIDNANGDGRYSPEAQAHAVKVLTQQIMAQYSSNGKGQLLGAALFEFADEWWKDKNGDPDVHDIGGIAPGGGPYPDLEFNEEWWGIVDIDRNPRLAYQAIKDLYSEN
ncbi:hypothetical protein MLD52_12925 [Puniceicoccaceae bacterium K14]|nr:hypothetical protein [Puniceicoccaceae bacterium K14]